MFNPITADNYGKKYKRNKNGKESANFICR